ncbi:DUF892 family protein [Pedobacter faecalis]|uniref:DUF892 family protein n=1 Tax=Pedobacter faecalis TaxID=3041495 RepID=UPI00254B44F4|nr:DUF892 family protein [Pedobacter sp. ELA7]
MNQQSNRPNSWVRIKISPDKLMRFFLDHLDRIYMAKMHLIRKLPELHQQAHFADLRNAIQETITAVEEQLTRLQMIYTILDADVTYDSSSGLTGLIEDAFQAIESQSDEPELQDLSIIFYLQNIESVEMASFQILQMAAVNLKNKQVSTLLKENYEQAKAGRALFLLISSKYSVN